MSLAALFLLVIIAPSSPSSQASDVPCDRPLKELELQMKVTAENLAAANQPAIPGKWPLPRKTVECGNSKCRVEAHQGVKLSYEPFNFFSDRYGLVAYPEIDERTESMKLASLEWQYDLERQSCQKNSN